MSYIDEQFKTVSRRLTTILVGMSVFLVAMLGFVLYETNVLRFGGDVTANEVYETAGSSPALSQYLEEEKDYEAHFVTLASLIKKEQQDAIGTSLLIASVPALLIAVAAALAVSNLVVKPVRESYESQERFMQDAAHELRNPLAAISLAIENAKGSKTADTDFMITVRRQTNRLVRINEDLLYLERRRPGVAIHPVDISSLLHDVLEDLQPSIVEKKITISADIQEGLEFSLSSTDFVKMSKNILENAIKYSKPGKRVSVSLSRAGSKTIFKVSDRGIGIPKAELIHIGKRFYRAKNAASIEGNGLGVAIVLKVVNLYGGTYSIQSTLNKGTTVEIYL